MMHIFKNNRQEGPFAEEEVRQKISRGELALTDLGWREGLANWTPLSEILGMPAPPSLPASVGSPAGMESSSKRGTILIVVIAALGLVGGLLDIYVGQAILTEIRGLHNEVATQHWLVQAVLEWLYKSYGSQAIEIAHTGAYLLTLCGVIGGIGALCFGARRYTAILSVLLIICGVAPLLHRGWEFVGLPMAAAGALGLFARAKKIAL